METAGEITTDYSIMIESSPGSSHKQAVAKIGEAVHKLELKSKRGAITISRIFDMKRSDSKTIGGDQGVNTEVLAEPTP